MCADDKDIIKIREELCEILKEELLDGIYYELAAYKLDDNIKQEIYDYLKNKKKLSSNENNKECRLIVPNFEIKSK